MTQLILKRANASRSSGDWRDDDYDVLEAGGVVGRIFFSPVTPQDRPWMWASGHSADSVGRAAHGYAATREAAMEAFARSWHREAYPSGEQNRSARICPRRRPDYQGGSSCLASREATAAIPCRVRAAARS